MDPNSQPAPTTIGQLLDSNGYDALSGCREKLWYLAGVSIQRMHSVNLLDDRTECRTLGYHEPGVSTMIRATDFATFQAYLSTLVAFQPGDFTVWATGR